MWEDKGDDINTPGKYMNLKDYHLVNGEKIMLTPAQRAYRDFVKSNMERLWKEVMYKTVDELGGKPVPMYKALGLPEELPEGFMPRVPISIGEAQQRENFVESFGGIKTRLRYFFRNTITNYLENTYYHKDPRGGLPLRYFQHAGFKEENILAGNYSDNVEVAFMSFADSLLNKKYLDDVYALSLGVKNKLAEIKGDRGEEKYKNLLKFMDDQISIHFPSVAEMQAMRTRPVRLKIPSIIAKPLGLSSEVEREMSEVKLMKLLKSSFSMAVMGFKALNALRNAALITLTNISQVTKGALSKIMGIPPDDFTPELKDALFAGKALVGVFKDFLTGNIENNKLWQLSKRADWMPDNYDYSFDRSNFVTEIPNFSLNNHAYMFHNFVESYGALMHLALMTKARKVTTADGKKVSV